MRIFYKYGINKILCPTSKTSLRAGRTMKLPIQYIEIERNRGCRAMDFSTCTDMIKKKLCFVKHIQK